MEKKIKWGTLILIAVLLCTYLAVHFFSGQKNDKLRLGYMPFASDLAIFIAKEKGYFDEEGLKIELIQFKSATDNLNALLAGHIDAAGMIGFPTLFAAYEKDSTLFKIFLGTAETESKWASAILIPPNSKLKNILELKGKILGTYTGATQLLNLKSILQNNSINESDIKIRQVQSELQIPSLQSEQFDALFTIEPTVTIALQKNIAKILVENPRYKYIVQPFPVTANCVSVDYYKNNPEVIKKLYHALKRATEDIRKNEEQSKTFLTKYTPLADSLVKYVHLYYWWLPEDINYNAIQKLADIFTEQALLKSKINTKKMFLTIN